MYSVHNVVITLTRDVIHDLLEGDSDDVITVSRELYGYFSLYTCIMGSVTSLVNPDMSVSNTTMCTQHNSVHMYSVTQSVT